MPSSWLNVGSRRLSSVLNIQRDRKPSRPSRPELADRLMCDGALTARTAMTPPATPAIPSAAMAIVLVIPGRRRLAPCPADLALTGIPFQYILRHSERVRSP